MPKVSRPSKEKVSPAHQIAEWFFGSSDRTVEKGYLAGLAGLSPRINTHAVTPTITPVPMPIATGESRTPPVAAGITAARPSSLFLSFSDSDSSRVVS